MKTISTCQIKKSENRVSEKIFSKLFFSVILALATTISSGQRVPPDKEVSMFNLSYERKGKIERYFATVCDGKSYIQWHVKNEREEGIFIIQRSENMKDFKIIGIKEDVPTTATITLMFSYIDKTPLSGISYYRILKVYNDNSYYYSDIETIENGAPENEEEIFTQEPLM